MNFPKVFNRIVAMLMSGIMTASIGTCSAFAEESTAIQSTAFQLCRCFTGCTLLL